MGHSLPLAEHAPANPAEGHFFWDEAKAQRAVDFIQLLTCHTKGRHAGTPFILEPWQAEEIVRPIFGTMMYDAQQGEYVRQYRIAWMEMARKLRTARVKSSPLSLSFSWWAMTKSRLRFIRLPLTVIRLH